LSGFWSGAMAFPKGGPFSVVQDGRIEFTLDPSMYDPGRVIPITDLYSHLDLALRKDLLYHYSGPISALNWIALCHHPTYGHIQLVNLLSRSLPRIMSVLSEHFSEQIPMCMVSLGPGDGEIDIKILRCLEDSFNVSRYYCLDFSFELLRYAVFRVSIANELKQSFRIKAICTNFAEAGGLRACEEESRLFSLNGFTLGNYSERALLGRIRQLMTERDLLLVDAHLHGLKSLEGRSSVAKDDMKKLLGFYSKEITNRFVFGPVEAVTTASVSDVQFDFRIHREMTAVPNALNVTILCKDLRTKMRFTGETIERATLDLASTTFYNYADLKEWFPSCGFQCVWEKQEGAIAIFLLQRSTP